MDRRKTVVALLSACATLRMVRQAAAWTLVTNEEIDKESRAAHPRAAIAPTPRRGAPGIDVVEPDATKPIKSPFSIHIRFRPEAGASIVPKSFRVKYGWLNLDITERLVGQAKVDASGVSADDAEIPPGDYKITLEITDNLGRIGTRTFEFRIV